MRTNYIKLKIDYTHHNSQWWLRRERNETINHIISELGKQAHKEFKTKPHLVGRVILIESCKWLNFSHTSKWYIHKPDSVQENETHEILCDIKIQTELLIPARRPDLVVIKRRISCLLNFVIPAITDWVKKRKDGEVIRPCHRTKKGVKNESDVDTNNSNLLNFLLRYGTRPYEWGSQWDSNPLASISLSSFLVFLPFYHQGATVTSIIVSMSRQVIL